MASVDLDDLTREQQVIYDMYEREQREHHAALKTAEHWRRRTLEVQEELQATELRLKARYEQHAVVCDDLRERIKRAERERDEYQGELHRMNERRSQMTSAASSAAATALTAVTQLEELMMLADAAVAWFELYRVRGLYALNSTQFSDLQEQVEAHVKRVKARS